MIQNHSTNNNEQNVQRCMDDLRRVDFLTRVFNRDETLWDGLDAFDQIVKGLEWIETAGQILSRVDEIQSIAQNFQNKSYKSIVIIGMGGSSVAKQMLFGVISNAQKHPELIFLNSILITEIARKTSLINFENALIVVISGSGETIETQQLFEYFWGKACNYLHANAKDHFIVITARNSPLSIQALDKGISQLFYFSGNLWGRFRALGMPGLLPAALAGVDIKQFASSVHSAVDIFLKQKNIEDNDAIQLGVELSARYHDGKRKLFIHYPLQLSGIAEWISELIAESTSKNGRGFISILSAPSEMIQPEKGSVHIFLGDDSSFLMRKKLGPEAELAIVLKDVNELETGREIVRWGLAILTFCYLNKINPFAEPQFHELVSQLRENLAHKKYVFFNENALVFEEGLLKDLLLNVGAEDYFAIHVFFNTDEATKNIIRRIQKQIYIKLHVPCIVCFGTSYMHSIGQQFKGGPNCGVFVQLTASNVESRSEKSNEDIPLNFETLLNTVINSEYEILIKHNRRVVKLDIGPDPNSVLFQFSHLINKI